MKKLTNISNQIQNNTFSYTGKGSFEAVVNKYKDSILAWLEELVPLQKQMELLREMEGLEFQKRNYTRILTKLFPDEYTEFVSLNILVRDASAIAYYYDQEFNITLLYDNLIQDNYLKYPGKYDKYVSYSIFQKFVMMYKDDLLKSLEKIDQPIKKPSTPMKEETKAPIQTMEKLTDENLTEEEKQEPIDQEEELIVPPIEKETNWTNLLLGRIK
jgi:hypothetical protein